MDYLSEQCVLLRSTNLCSVTGTGGKAALRHREERSNLDKELLH